MIAKSIILSVLVLLASGNARAVTQSDPLLMELFSRISQSKQALASTQAGIAEESSQFSAQLSTRQDQIRVYRDKAGSLQRLAEEQTLSLEQLENRMLKWAEQSQYQKHLIAAYIEKSSLDTQAMTDVDGEEVVDARVISSALSRLEGMLQPQWQTQSIVTGSGSVEAFQALAVGPVKVAFNPDSGEAGLLDSKLHGQQRLLEIFSQNQVADLVSLNEIGIGSLVFDPTLGNAFQLSQRRGNLLSHLQKGGVWALPILFFGALSFLISISKATQLFRLPEVDSGLFDSIIENAHELQNRSGSRQDDLWLTIKNLRGAQRKLVDIMISTGPSSQRDDLMVACLMEHRHKIEKYMGVVATSAAIAPLLGLLGTVSGMIETFRMMTIFGAGDAATVSGGISEALVTTELGLVVAIPSLIVSALLSRKSKSYNHKLETVAVRLSKVSV